VNGPAAAVSQHLEIGFTHARVEIIIFNFVLRNSERGVVIAKKGILWRKV
jgi:hypothetical protein